MAKAKKKQKARDKKKREAVAAAAVTSTSNGAVTMRNGVELSPSQRMTENGPAIVMSEPKATKPLGRSKQRTIVKRLMKQADAQGLQIGDKRFVVAAKWWERWCQYVGFDTPDGSNANGNGLAGVSSLGINSAPSKINNTPLLQLSVDEKLDELMGGPLHPQLKEQYHYVLVPQEVWDVLLHCYGGGPVIARFVVEVGDPTLGNAFKRVEMYPELAAQEDEAMTDSSSLDEEMPLQPIAPSPRPDASLVAQSSIPKVCGACRTTTGPMKRCGNCQLIWYCGGACQTAHWRFHRAVCRSAAPRNDKEFAIQNMFASERRGKTGLRNLGNTCFMNSALQCLSHVELLTKYFLSNKFHNDLNRENPLGTGGNLALDYDGLLKELWFGSSASITPAALKRAIGRFAPQFSGFQQHDSQELLAYLLDGLHEDLNRVKHKPYTEVKESDGKQDDAEVAREAWNRHLLRNDSIFVDHIQGQFKSTVVCPICLKVSITFDPFNCVQLELPIQQKRRMEVIVVPQGERMVRYWVEVPKKGSVINLKRAASKLCNIPANHLMVVDIYQSTMFRVVGDGERLTDLRDDDRILLYQVEPPTTVSASGAPPQLHYGFLYHRVDSSLGGDPLLFSFYDDTSCEEMLQTWSSMITAHVALKPAQPTKPNALTDPGTVPAEMLSPCVFLSNRDGVFLRNEPVPMSKSSRFIDYATLQADDTVRDVVFVTVAWTSALMVSTGNGVLRPHVEHVVDHTSMREKYEGTGSMRNGITLDDCFRNFTKPETLDQANLWYCSSCKEHRQARKTMEIWSLPDVLIISLKRFEYRNEILRDKLDVFVDFPLDELDMTPYCLEQQQVQENGLSSSTDPDSLCYDLFAVSNHYGSMGFGHYTAYARSWQNGDKYPGWYSFDDSQVSPAMPGQVKSNAAYILFYKRRHIAEKPARVGPAPKASSVLP